VPSLENTKHYGYGIRLPYTLHNENQRFTLMPKVYQKGSYALDAGYSIDPIDNDRWSLSFNGSIVNDREQSANLTNTFGVTELDEGMYKPWRGYAKLVGHYDFDNDWVLNYNLSIASDRYYFRDYYLNNASYLESRIKFVNVNTKQKLDFNYIQLTNLFYQELLETNSSYETPRYVPVVNFHIQDTVFKNDTHNIYYQLYSDTTSLFRRKGSNYNRFTLMPAMNDTIKTDFGVLNLNLNLRGDMYVLNNMDYKGNSNRLFPQLNAEWRHYWNLGRLSLQPIVKYSGSPRQEEFELRIPNEDSVQDILSFENIFSDNRFIGYDRQEYGNRVTVGLEGNAFDKVSLGIARGYRDYIPTEQILGFNGSTSDYVGYISYMLNENVDVYYRFLTDKEDFLFKKHEINLNINFSDTRLYLVYTKLNGEIAQYVSRDTWQDSPRKQINIGTDFNLFNRWKFNISFIMDMENENKIMQSNVGISYDGGCTFWRFYYSNTNPISETERNTSIKFEFGIKEFGGW